MKSIMNLFELGFRLPIKKFKSTLKRTNLPSLPLSLNRKSFGRIKKMNSKLANINNQIQR